MSKRAASPVSCRVSGDFLGVKVHTSNNSVRSSMAYVNRRINFSNARLFRELKTIFNERFRKRIPKLKHQLRFGYKGLFGTLQLESRPHNHDRPQSNHRPHIQIREPLGRIVDRGMSFKLEGKKNTYGVRMKVYDSRNSALNFHSDMSKVPKTSTVWRRLDATCLPFVEDGHQAAILENWLNLTTKTLIKDMDRFLKGKRISSSEV